MFLIGRVHARGEDPIVLDPFYNHATGNLLPVYEDILLQNVHDLSPESLTLAA